jgi:hypothetical protein
MENAATTLAQLITDSSASAQRVSDYLDGLTPDERIAAIRGTERRTQIKLWKLVDGFRELSCNHFVKAGTPNFQAVRHHGRNTMPTFVLFEKRFYRYGDGSQMAGANFQHISPITGPGYFLCTEDKNRREVQVDYYHVPDQAPPGWPKIVPNSGFRMTKLVYGNMVDVMRRVSEHVTIGHAIREGKEFPAWFLLCREDRA